MIDYIVKRLTPNILIRHLSDIDLDQLQRLGITHVYVDIDNTVCERNKLQPDWKMKKVIREIKEAGFMITLVSNSSKPNRVIRIASFLEIDALLMCSKPMPWIYRKIYEQDQVDPGQCLFVGDQLLTDVLGANRSGARTCYCYPIGPELNPLRRSYIALEKQCVNWLQKKRST